MRPIALACLIILAATSAVAAPAFSFVQTNPGADVHKGQTWTLYGRLENISGAPAEKTIHSNWFNNSSKILADGPVYQALFPIKTFAPGEVYEGPIYSYKIDNSSFTDLGPATIDFLTQSAPVTLTLNILEEQVPEPGPLAALALGLVALASKRR
ncbi:MAG: PEP-CTERM sorting domain-containing protein [Chthoniobacterales bacterium]